MKNSWFFSLALLLFTCSIQAQSRFEFWPQGHINVLADFKGGYYVTMGGPSFTLLKKDQLQAGVHFALYIVQCAVCSVQCAVCSVCSVQCIVCSV